MIGIASEGLKFRRSSGLGLDFLALGLDGSTGRNLGAKRGSMSAVEEWGLRMRKLITKEFLYQSKQVSTYEEQAQSSYVLMCSVSVTNAMLTVIV